ncbi:sepiapterin reductase-like [Mercenaria mercenaria]|uniref:sepiapterin reductase-like n=1 Tax=Mercenaria mercenaria TaxID=6596 RepID=UPI00234EA2CF|nr:sepiapterin reductase-like [Mercenaria mercenaria]XP_045169053.2 sepiapterin reductase-like [Mercenaria mercenaria]
MSKSLLKGKALCVITGASRGYGRCLAEMFVTHLPAGSLLLLLARNTDQLTEVSARLTSLNNSVRVAWEKFDQSNVTDCSQENIHSILSKAEIRLQDFNSVFLVHNAGSVGDLTKYAWEFSDGNMVANTINLNVTGTVLLNASLLNEIRKYDIKQKIVVNVSSLAAIQPFSSWSLYCAGKAARDMFFQTLAAEDQTLRVLNWAPGPLDTDMQALCRECADPTLRQTFNDMHKNGSLLKCKESAAKLITLLEKNTFVSGQHIDYYDNLE